jgi:uncharacterized protein
MEASSFEQVKKYVLLRLENELAPGLAYHSLAHTRDDVVPAVERLADMEGVQGESRILLLTAAWFHDLGFIEQMAGHEAISMRIAEDVLPDFDYATGQIATVCNAIMATKLPQSPKSRLEEILADADLDVLGRDDFLPRNQALRDELQYLGRKFTDFEWYTSQESFLRDHSYFTKSAHALRDSQKMLNIVALQDALAGA